MNTSEWEQQLKNLLDNQEYAPKDQEWERMHQALHPAAPKKAVWFLLPVWKAAAAAVLLLGTGTAGYFWMQQKEQPGVQSVARQQVRPAVTQPEQQSSPLPPTTHEPAILALQKKIAKGTNARQPATAGRQVLLPGRDTATALIAAAKPEPNGQLHQEKEKNTTGTSFPSNTSANTARQLWPDTYTPTAREQQKLNFGFAAQIGKPSQGNMQYNVGVVVRQELNKVLYAEAGLALASTQVNYSENIRIPGSSPGDGLGANNGGGTPARTIDARYSGNMFAIGLSPSIGIKATGNLSVAIGGDLYRSLNRTLESEPQAAGGLSSEGFTLVNPPLPARGIAEWDAGLRGQIEYRIGKKLSLNTQYRQGLSRYILVDGSTYRNSTFNVGMKFYPGR